MSPSLLITVRRSPIFLVCDSTSSTGQLALEHNLIYYLCRMFHLLNTDRRWRKSGLFDATGADTVVFIRVALGSVISRHDGFTLDRVESSPFESDRLLMQLRGNYLTSHAQGFVHDSGLLLVKLHGGNRNSGEDACRSTFLSGFLGWLHS